MDCQIICYWHQNGAQEAEKLFFYSLSTMPGTLRCTLSSQTSASLNPKLCGQVVGKLDLIQYAPSKVVGIMVVVLMRNVIPTQAKRGKKSKGSR